MSSLPGTRRACSRPGHRVPVIMRADMIAWLLVAAALGYAASRVFLGYPRPGRPCATLAPREVAFLAAAAEATYPPGGAIPSSGLDAGIPGYADRLLAAAPPRSRFRMRLLLFFLEHATLIFPAPGRGGMRRFSALRAEQRVAVLDGWAESRLFARRLVFMSLRAILTMGFFADPQVLRQLGLAPLAVETPICEADLLYPRIGERPESIRLTRDDLAEPSDGTPLALDGPLHPQYAEDTL